MYIADLRDGVDKACEAVGGKAELGRRIGVSGPAISQWDKVPADRLVDVETATGVPREELRPDLYRKPEDSP